MNNKEADKIIAIVEYLLQYMREDDTQNDAELDLMDHMKEWIKTQQDPKFWETTKRVNLSVMLAEMPDQKRNDLVHDIVVLVKLAQMAAFHDGLRQGKREAAQQIAVECKKFC